MTADPDRQPLTYRQAGVDIGAGDRLVEMIKPLTRATARPGANGEIGGFGGVFDPRAAGFRDPLLVAATDGVGTKLRVAIESGMHDRVGIDLVAMCVNDLVVQGAEPLFFLDYYATAKLDVDVARAVVAGIAEGCRIAGCALIGGETAEMPGMYREGDYDLAGFAVGAVERDNLITGREGRAGDVLLAVASSGPHSNGYSLVRRVVQREGLAWDGPVPWGANQTLGEALLEPTRIYVKPCFAAVALGGVAGMAHITGGGLIENPPRAYPRHLAARIDAAAWELPPVFGWLAEAGGIAPEELARTFNCGIGMLMIVRPDAADAVAAALTAAGEQVAAVGTLAERGDGAAVVIDGIERWRR